MTVELTFEERCTVKLGIGALAAATAFLDAEGVRPSTTQMQRIVRDCAAVILEIVRQANPQADDLDFTGLIAASADAGVNVAAAVMGLNAPAPAGAN